MDLSSLNVSLSKPLQEYVENRVESGEFGTPADYVRTLIRRERHDRLEAFQDELVEALDSGEVTITRDELMAEDFIETLRASQIT